MKFRSAARKFPVFLFSVFLIALLFTSFANADDLPQFYTIQSASYSYAEAAQKEYQRLFDTLLPQQRDHLRIEKVGRYYTVRLGRFASQAEADGFLGAVDGTLAGALILQAYIKPERISRQYSPVLAEETSEPSLLDVATVQKIEADSSKTVSSEKEISAEIVAANLAEQQEFYTIQAGSYSQEQSAADLYQSLAETLASGQRDHLRIEKVGKYYTVRLGRFASQAEADGFLGAVDGTLAGALILQAYIKPERISRLYESVEGPVIAVADSESVQQFADPEPAVVLPAPDEEKKVAADSGLPMPDSAVAAEPAEMAEDTSSFQPEPAAESMPVDSPVTEEGDEAAEPEAEKVFRELGQPTGFQPVRVVKILSTDMYGNTLFFPSGLHYEPVMDELYVSSSGANVSTRISVFGADFFPVAAIGEGRGVKSVRGLTVDRDGNIYIAQGNTQDAEGGYVAPKIMVLNAAFFKIREIFFDNIKGITGEFFPMHLALGKDNDTLYVTGSFDYHGVLALDLEGNFKRWLAPIKVGNVTEEIGDNPAHPNALKVLDVVVDANGRIYLLCDPGRIFVLGKDEKFLFAFGEFGGSTGKLSNPRSIGVDVQREAIYVVDYMRHSVNVYDYKSGKYLLEFGGRGGGPGWFNFPNHVEVDRRGNVIVSDMFSHRVQVLYVP